MSFREYLNEAPKTIIEINNKYLDLKLTREIEKAIIENSFYKISNEIQVIPISMTESIYVWIVHNEIIGAIRTTYKNFKGRFLEISLSKKYDESQKGMLAKMLPIISNEEKMKIISGDEFTGDSVAAWIKFLREPEKYNIKEIYILNTVSNEKLEFIKNQTFGPADKFKNKRIVIEFN